MEDLQPNKALKKRTKISKKQRSFQAKNQPRNEAGKFAKTPIFSGQKPINKLKKINKKTPQKTVRKPTQKARKKPLEERSFFGRIGAIFSGEAQRKIRRNARKNSTILRAKNT